MTGSPRSYESPTSPASPSSVVDDIPLSSNPLDEDANFWYQSTGPTLWMLMHHAGYDLKSQYQYLLFYQQYIAPLMGRRPHPDGQRTWDSFMTDDKTPIELSWSWTGKQTAPTVRFAIEPIGKFAGTSYDPLNLDIMPNTVEEMMPWLTKANLEWYHALSKELVVKRNRATPTSLDDHCSQIFLGFDLCPKGILAKAYFLPAFKAEEEGLSKWEVIRNTIFPLAEARLGEFSPMVRALSRLENFMESRPSYAKLEAEIVAVDCIDPHDSRIKIYLRSRHTTFKDVKSIFTLGGTQKVNKKGLEELRRLWGGLFGLGDDFSSRKPLMSLDHRTAGILYYFDLNNKSELPSPKVYLPVRHYAQNDLHIAMEVERYLQRTNPDFVGGSYVNAIRQTFTHRPLESGRGIHTYITCMMKGGSLAVTSYFNPEIYCPGRN